MVKARLYSIQGMSLMATSSTASFKDTDALSQNLINMKASSKMANIMVKASISGVPATSTKVPTKMAKSMVMEFIRVLMVLSTRVTGRTAKEMEKVSKYRRLVLFKKYFLRRASRNSVSSDNREY